MRILRPLPAAALVVVACARLRRVVAARGILLRVTAEHRPVTAVRHPVMAARHPVTAVRHPVMVGDPVVVRSIRVSRRRIQETAVVRRARLHTQVDSVAK
jgi:hypothetical protein